MKRLKWTNHADLATRKTPTVGRREYLDYMTFQSRERPLFTEIFGPIIGLKEEWEAQGTTPRTPSICSVSVNHRKGGCLQRSTVIGSAGRNLG